jgi:hypothetical protein
MNVVICRTFLRSVLLWVIDPQRVVTDRHVKYRSRIDRLEISRFAGLSPSRELLRSVWSVSRRPSRVHQRYAGERGLLPSHFERVK